MDPNDETEGASLTITEGTIFLIAEILRAERGAAMPDIEDAGEAIKNALKALASKPG